MSPPTDGSSGDAQDDEDERGNAVDPMVDGDLMADDGEDGEERQGSLDDFPIDVADGDRCQAIADSTGERCQHPVAGPFPYCGDHLDLLDDVDKKQMGLKLPKSGG